jgi:hypothetical protein
MSWELVKSIQKTTDLRLVLPFGLNLKLGDVVAVGKDGVFTLEGTSASLLGMPAGAPRPAGTAIDLMEQSGNDTKIVFRPQGTASGLFEGLPSAQAGFDISFDSATSWLLAVTGRALASLDEINRFREPILGAYARGVWKADWALVTGIATAQRMTVLASRTRGTKVALGLAGEVTPNAPLELKFTADASILATSHQITQCIANEPLTAFCSAIRVSDTFWSSPTTGALAHRTIVKKDVAAAADAEFWEEVDDVGP